MSNFWPNNRGRHVWSATWAANDSTFRASYLYCAPFNFQDIKATGSGCSSSSYHCNRTVPTAFWLPSMCTAVRSAGSKCRRTGADVKAVLRLTKAVWHAMDQWRVWRPPLVSLSSSVNGADMSEYRGKRVLKDFRWFIRHHSSVVESAALKKISNPYGPRFDSGRKHVTSDSHGFEHIDPQSRVLNYCFQ